jgi:hypothetical protein
MFERQSHSDGYYRDFNYRRSNLCEQTIWLSNSRYTRKLPPSFLGIRPDAWTAIFTGVLSLFKLALAIVAAVQIYFLTKADKTARVAAEAAKTSAQAAERANRPWIKVSISLFGPIVFEDHGATFHVRFLLKNIGIAPATTVDVWPKIVLGYAVDHKPAIDMGAELENIIKEQKAMPKGTEKFGYSIFPKEKMECDVRVCVQKSEIEKSVAIRGYISPTLIGAARYNFAQDSETHYTGFIVYIDKRGLVKGAGTVIG